MRNPFRRRWTIALVTSETRYKLDGMVRYWRRRRAQRFADNSARLLFGKVDGHDVTHFEVVER